MSLRVRGLVAAWRRRFASVQTSPAIENFLCWLGETPYAWYVASDSKLRGHDHAEEFCAITGVVRHRTGVCFSVGDWVRAADTIGLSFGEAALIVAAADGTLPPDARVALLRQRLLIASRIASPVGTAQARFAAIRELAGLIAGHVYRDDLCPSPAGVECRAGEPGRSHRGFIPVLGHLTTVGMGHKR
jgi:hypothetical protein